MPDRWTQAEARETPVASDACLWCKGDVDGGIPVGQDERLCAACHGDLREWSRYRFVELYVSAGLEPATRRVVRDHWQAIQADLAAVYADHDDLFPLPSVKSNADGRDVLETIEP